MIDWLLAADIYLTLGGWSEHTRQTYRDCSEHMIKSECGGNTFKYNESHEAFILEADGFTVGTYKNSYNFRTNLVGYTYRYNDFSVSANYGTGYRENKNFQACKIPLGHECLLLSASYSFEPFKLSLMGSALALSFELKLQ